MSHTKKYSQSFHRCDTHEETITDTETIRRRTSTLTSYRTVDYVERQQRESPDGPGIDPDAASMPPIAALPPKQIPRRSGDRRAGPDA